MLGIGFLALASFVSSDLAGPLELELEPGFSVTAVEESVYWFGPRSYSFVGHVRGELDSTIVLSVRQGTLWGRIDTDRGRYRIRPGGDSYRVEVVAEEVLHPARSPLVPAASPRVRASSFADDGTLLDVLVVYTPKARAAAGGTEAIESLVQLGVTDTNLALERSEVGARIRLVHLREIDYEEAGDVEGDLELLQRAADGAADEVHALRDAYGADFVQLVVEEGDGCGIAYLMGSDDPGFEEWAFSVVERACIDASFGVAHELGHNLGCDHALEDPTSDGAFGFSHGYKDLAAGFRTVMAYGPGRRLPRFSNPRIAFRGTPIGNELSDNARSIDRLRTTLANFRPSLSRPRITTPVPGSVLSWPSRFAWTISSSGVEEWWLFLGTTPGGRDLFDSGSLGPERSLAVDPAVANGEAVYARLWYRRGSVWLFEDFQYRSR